jgi:hypothetical protein
VACAVTVQKGVAERQAEVPTGRRIVSRIGINIAAPLGAGLRTRRGDDLILPRMER